MVPSIPSTACSDQNQAKPSLASNAMILCRKLEHFPASIQFEGSTPVWAYQVTQHRIVTRYFSPPCQGLLWSGETTCGVGLGNRPHVSP